ncbi:hypothetical protein N4R57_08940 [Rhodobacteraceae bacterium D3-12]|nr:hypothetical protein N4R57_08940 [Rhodobacteraceae bacterium D3-12]
MTGITYISDAAGAPATAPQGTDDDDSYEFRSSPTALQLDTGAGRDTVIFDAYFSQGALQLGEGDDILTSSQGTTSATIASGEGDDTLTLTGSQSLRLGLDGGDGNDLITMNRTGYSTLQGGAGDDLFVFSDERVYQSEIDAGSGNDTIQGLDVTTATTVTGGDGTDRLVFNQARDTFTAEQIGTNRWMLNNRTIVLMDRIEEFVFDGVLYDGEDVLGPLLPITGTDMGEVIAGTDAPEQINALGGNDWVTPMAGFDRVDGGAGVDMVSYAGSVSGPGAYGVGVRIDLHTNYAIVQSADGASASQTILNFENATGTSFHDRLTGDEGANWLRGLGGSDLFTATAGADTLDGGAGTDTLKVSESRYEYSDNDVSLLRGTAWAGDAAGDTLLSIENITAGNGDDRLAGDHGANFLSGGYGDDTLIGNAGDDTLTGGAGTDTAVFSYDRDQYEIIQHPNLSESQVVRYIGPGAGDGTDTLLHFQVPAICRW